MSERRINANRYVEPINRVYRQAKTYIPRALKTLPLAAEVFALACNPVLDTKLSQSPTVPAETTTSKSERPIALPIAARTFTAEVEISTESPQGDEVINILRSFMKPQYIDQLTIRNGAGYRTKGSNYEFWSIDWEARGSTFPVQVFSNNIYNNPEFSDFYKSRIQIDLPMQNLDLSTNIGRLLWQMYNMEGSQDILNRVTSELFDMPPYLVWRYFERGPNDTGPAYLKAISASPLVSFQYSIAETGSIFLDISDIPVNRN